MTIAAIILMTILEAIHVIYLGIWNSEIFIATTSLAGLVVGTLVGAETCKKYGGIKFGNQTLAQIEH